jgi:hypothetical protein
MRHPASIALRFGLIAALVIGLAAVLAPSPTQNNPYLSALSVAGLGSVSMASPTCADKACDFTTIKCFHNVGTNCGIKGDGCVITRAC